MDYLIHNAACIREEGEREEAIQRADTLFRGIQSLGTNYPRPIVLDLFFQRNDSGTYTISAVINLNGEIMYLRESGTSPVQMLPWLFDSIRIQISRKIDRDRREYRTRRSQKQSSDLWSKRSDLKELKRRDVREEFNHLLHLISHDVARYIRRRLRSAEMTSAVNRGKFKVQELLDELYLKVYDRIEEVPEEEPRVNLWLMHLADQVLEEQLRELDFEKKYFEELESFIEQEDIPVEEVEDFSSMADWYSARSLFQADNEDSILDELTLKLDQDEIHRAIEYELARLPFFKRTIMDLYLINQMAVEEIAELKGITVTEAEAVIREVSGTLVRKLSSLLAS